MQRCPNCGTMIPDNARFCSNCGHVPTTGGARNLAAGEQDWSTVPESSLSGTSAPGSGQPPAGNIPPVQNAFFSGPTQDLGQNPNLLPASSFTPSQTPPPTYGTQPPVQGRPAGPLPPNSNVPTRKPSRRILGVPLAWLLTILACLIVVAAGVGVFAAVLRPRSSHPAGTPGAGTPSATCTNGKSCATPTKGITSTPVVAGPTDLNFSGAIAGHMENIKYSTCGVTNGGSQYNISLQGKIGGTNYNFVFRIGSFKDPGNYNTGQIIGSLIQQPVSFGGTWVNTGSQSANATVNSDKKTGVMNMDLAGQINTAHVTGNWSCP